MLKTAKLLLLPVLLVGAAFLFQQSRELWLNGALWTMVYALVLLMGYFYYRERQQRIRAEENERLYRETFEQTSLGIAHVTENGRWLRVNSRFCEILGYSREELLQKTFQEITHPDDLNKDVELARQVWTRKIPSYTLEKRYVRKDGSLVWALLSVSLSTTKTGEPQYFISSAKDISIRKQAEEALMESTIQLRLATEAAQLGIWEYDLSTRRFRGSGRQWQLLGLDEPGDNFAPFNLSNHIHKDDRANVEATFLAAIQAKSEFSCEYRFQNAKGEKIWLESIGSPLLDAEGNVVRMVGVNMDITNRKLAQIDFQRSVDVSPAILWISEKDGECSYLSQQWYAFTGQTKKEALGLGWLNAVHHEDREHAYQFFSKANANREPYYVEYRLRTAVDDYRWVIDAGNPRYDSDGFFLGYAGTIFDIHDKKLAQARLEDTVQQFKALANSIPQLAWMADSNGKLFWFNERWFQYTGTTPEEMQQDGWIKVHHPDHVDRVMKRLNQSLATGEIWEDTFPIRSVSGGWRWFLSRAYPLFSENGQIERWFGTNTDITELREFQIALAKSETSFRDLANSMPHFKSVAELKAVYDAVVRMHDDRAS